MALSRQWYTRANIPFPDVSSALISAKSMLWLIKAMALQQVSTGTLGPEGAPPGGSAWACTGSSDSVAAGMDAVDRWGSSFDASKIVRGNGAVAKSWFVMRHSGLGVSVCISYDGASDTNATIVGSYLEFSGGGTTARPTSAQEFAIVAAGTIHNGNSGANQNAQFSVDASGNWYMHFGQVGAGFTYFALWGCALAEARAGDTRKFFLAQHFLNSGRGAPSIGSMTAIGRTIGNSANTTGGMLRTTLQGATFHGALEANAADSAFDTLPVQVGCNNVGQGGIRGRFPDAICGGAMNVGGSDPTTGAQLRACFGDAVTPHSVVPAL